MRTLRCGITILLCLAVSAEIIPAGETVPAKTTVTGSQEKNSPKKKPEKKPKSASATKTTKAQRMKGEIIAMNSAAGTLTVKGAADEKSFVAQDAAKDSLERLKIGERVRVTYSEKDGKIVATSIRRMKVKPASAASHEKKPTKTQAAPTKSGIETKNP